MCGRFESPERGKNRLCDAIWNDDAIFSEEVDHELG